MKTRDITEKLDKVNFRDLEESDLVGIPENLRPAIKRLYWLFKNCNYDVQAPVFSYIPNYLNVGEYGWIVDNTIQDLKNRVEMLEEAKQIMQKIK